MLAVAGLLCYQNEYDKVYSVSATVSSCLKDGNIVKYVCYG